MLALVWLLLAAVTQAQEGLIANLDYGSFKGAYSSEYNISYWQKIPFAAKPIGPNRFRAPQPPDPITNGTYDSSKTFDMCVQRTTNGTEDCLYLGLYGRPWKQGQSLRPVVVVWHGGAFIQGSATFTIPPSAYPILNVSALNDFVVVYSSYRVNAFGFLPGRQVADSRLSDLNVGLLDQQAALRWTRKYINNFGGDPANVTIWGQSAGAGSVVAQVIANGGRTSPRLFSRALISSPFWPKTYRYDSSEAQEIYDRFAELAGCAGEDSLSCLKAVDVQTLRNASLAISASHTYNTSSYTWAPVIDDEFICQPLSQASASGAVNVDFTFSTYNAHEGENFVPPGLQNATGAEGFNSTAASFDAWLSGFLPKLSSGDLDCIRDLYPASGEVDGLVYNSTYVRAGLVYRDSVLACPALWTAKSSRARQYMAEYTIDPAKHGSDTQYWNQVNEIQKTDPVIYDGYAGAFASFFQAGDPNLHKLTAESEPGVPELTETKQKFVVNTDGFQNLPIKDLERRCDFWRSIAERVPI
ncbi:Carboxylesterase patB [Pseudocercospora fuligena]|uniref:Carboxylic ester hydrolase n=1 Tax=Pseudocercospora fuligena TaxID=685502 RepID=A0A8H6RCR6_9PEZI|nr:Carboxylesterase patB [Pseudocercospora fuligena]